MRVQIAPAPDWVLRASLAGVTAALTGTAFGTFHYLGLPGALELDWSIMLPVVMAFAVGSGLIAGLSIAAGMLRACRGRSRVGFPRLVLGAALGGAFGGLVPGLVGIAGLGSLPAPYAGTGNILFSALVAATVLVTFLSPILAPARGSLTTRLGIAAIASIVAGTTMGALAWAFATRLGIVPDLDDLRRAVAVMGLVPLALVGGASVTAGTGALTGLAVGLSVAAMHPRGLSAGTAPRPPAAAPRRENGTISPSSRATDPRAGEAHPGAARCVAARRR